MKSALVVLAGILAVSAIPSKSRTEPGVPPPDQSSAYRYDIRVELVGLFASVLDRSGKLVTGLDRDDFVLYEDEQPQVISQFGREYIPLSITFLLDTSGSMDGEKLANARKSLVHFLNDLNRGDEAMLMEFRSRPRVVQPFTDKFGLIARELKRLEGNGSTALYDAILAALDQMRSARNRRRAILLISDGINTYGKARLEDTLAGLQRHGIELFSIGLETDFPESAEDRVITREVLDQLTRSAGGESFIISDSKELRRICEIISNQMHNQYSLAYYPPRAAEGEWRSIRLETKSRGFRVVPSRTGYFASH